MPSPLERELAQQIHLAGLPTPDSECRFAPPRKWRLDLCWPEKKCGVEISGGIWTRGRHVRGTGYQNDCDKLNTALLTGWKVLVVTGQDIQSGKALGYVQALLEGSL